MTNKKRNIAILLGDPSGIGPELVSKLLSQNELDQANIIVIGEKNILENGNKITGNSHNLNLVKKFEEIKKLLQTNIQKTFLICWDIKIKVF